MPLFAIRDSTLRIINLMMQCDYKAFVEVDDESDFENENYTDDEDEEYDYGL